MQSKKRRFVEVIVTDEFYKNAKHLYRTALRYVKARSDYQTADEAERHYRLLRKALTRFNYGIDPLAEGGARRRQQTSGSYTNRRTKFQHTKQNQQKGDTK